MIFLASREAAALPNIAIKLGKVICVERATAAGHEVTAFVRSVEQDRLMKVVGGRELLHHELRDIVSGYLVRVLVCPFWNDLKISGGFIVSEGWLGRKLGAASSTIRAAQVVLAAELGRQMKEATSAAFDCSVVGNVAINSISPTYLQHTQASEERSLT